MAHDSNQGGSNGLEIDEAPAMGGSFFSGNGRLNLYLFSGNDPVNSFDLLGLKTVEEQDAEAAAEAERLAAEMAAAEAQSEKSMLFGYIKRNPGDETGVGFLSDSELLLEAIRDDDDGFLGFGKDSILSDGDVLKFDVFESVEDFAASAKNYGYSFAVGHGTLGSKQNVYFYQGKEQWKHPRIWNGFFRAEGVRNLRGQLHCNPGDGIWRTGGPNPAKDPRNLLFGRILPIVEEYLDD